MPLPAEAENRHLVMGWVPRRTRLVAPDQNFERFAATLSAPPYNALIGAEQWELVAHPAFNADASECELSVRVLPAAGPPWTEFRFRMRCVDSGSFRGCWMVRHVEAPNFPFNYQ